MVDVLFGAYVLLFTKLTKKRTFAASNHWILKYFKVSRKYRALICTYANDIP